MDAAELELVRRARRGDAEAFRGIVETHSRFLWRAAFRVLGDAAAAEDAVQSAFLSAWRTLDRFDDRAQLSTWLYRIVMNAAIDLRRQRTRREALAGALPEDARGEVTVRSPTADPHRQAVWRQLADRAREVIGDLSETERTAVLLRHFEGCTTAEIARALGGDESAAKQAVFRAVRKLRAALVPLMEVSRETSI
ncbi:MAG TPA: RNA polymerase sigma factor [Candidatus Polarisedimenticolaceae bacterium]|nr:RNA polymerase sigma factor [Candidatus Polarisedimenticolaceae bacterium]